LHFISQGLEESQEQERELTNQLARATSQAEEMTAQQAVKEQELMAAGQCCQLSGGVTFFG
jgi:hypothetical protein